MNIRLLVLLALLLSRPGVAEEPDRPAVDYLAFANGALPLVFGDSEGVMRVTSEQALALIDGNPGVVVMTPKPGGPEASIEFIYELPAATVFSGFAVPSILETPSPYQTFFGHVQVLGAMDGPDGPFSLVAEQTLQRHEAKGQVTTFPATSNTPVRWVKVVLSGGLDLQRDKTFFEFSELYGYGTQEAVADSTRFSGKWKGRGVLMELRQDGKLVTGCYDDSADLTGAVNGSILYATGVDRNDGVSSSFVLMIDPEGRLTGLRSTNGAPFRLYPGDPAPENMETGCSSNEEKPMGCGSVVYGINFAFDSAQLLEESGQVLDALYSGLAEEDQATIVIEGHTSSEGSEAYNQALSERRAQAVVSALQQRGISNGRLSAQGLGESQPIASNNDEAGRALNRRVAVRCSST